jgi:hypothetical protein
MNGAVSKQLGMVAVSGLALVLAACSSPTTPTTGGGSGGGGGSKYTKIGVVLIQNFGTNRSLFGTFYKPATAQSAPTDVFGPLEDTCKVSKNSATSGIPNLADPAATPTPLGAGPKLTVNKGGAVTATLNPLSAIGGNSNNVTYRTESGTVVPDTSTATLEIPGETGGFPASSVPLPTELADFTLNAAPSGPVTKDSTFSWTSPTAGAYLVLKSYSGAGADSVYVVCFAKDDGSFAFPTATKTELDSNGFTSSSSTSGTKYRTSSVTKDDSILYLISTRSSPLTL